MTVKSRSGQSGEAGPGKPSTSADGVVGAKATCQSGARQTDITDHTRADEDLSRFFDLSLHFLLITDLDGYIKRINPTWERVLGFAKEELLAKRCLDFVYPDDREASIREMQRLARGEPVPHFENRYVCKDGSFRWLAWSGVPYLEAGLVYGVAADVTEQKRAEEALRRSEARLGSIFRAARVGIGLVSNRVVLQANRQLCEMLGYASEELIGKSARILYPSDEEYEWVGTEKYGQIREKGMGTVETRWVTKDGRVIDVLLSSCPLDPSDLSAGVTFTALDITERKRSEQAVRDSEEKYKTLFEASAESIFLMKDVFLDCNEAAARMWACTKEDIIGKSPVAFSPPKQPDGRDSMESAREKIQAALAGKPQFFTWQHLRKDGGLIDMEIALKALTVGDETLILATGRDITERKRMEEERRRMEAQLRHTQKLESLGILAGGIAHDFNNLLVGVLGNADLALMDLSPMSPARESIKEIETAAMRAADLCRQMLAYSGKGKFVVEPIDLNELVNEMGHLLDVSISKKIMLKYDLATDLPAVEGDVTQIRQVVMNLITNASEAIGDRSGVISIRTGAMACDRSYLDTTYFSEGLPEGLYVYLEVADTGCGMDEETEAKMFDPFYTTKFTGRGLGLAAVLGIIRGHGGAQKVYSEQGVGTTFKVLLPAADSAAETRPGDVVELDGWQGSGTILLVDDEDTVRAVGKRMLEKAGFSVLTASDGSEAIECFKRHTDEIVCVLLDLTMPQMDGEETFRHLRQMRKGVPVILSSGYNEQEVINRFAGKGLAGFVQKPYRPSTLLPKLKKLLES